MNLFTLSKTDTDKIHQSHQLSKWLTFGRCFCFDMFFSFFFKGPVKKLLKSPRFFFRSGSSVGFHRSHGGFALLQAVFWEGSKLETHDQR